MLPFFLMLSSDEALEPRYQGRADACAWPKTVSCQSFLPVFMTLNNQLKLNRLE